MNDRYTIYEGDCLQVLKLLADSSIDAIVTDPPYGLAFMGKKWDYDVPSVEVWAECLRVLKPGGHLLAFAGTRTQHRMAVRIEDAGFEIRDMICWVYASGFPKSLDVSKAIDKAAGVRGNDGKGFNAAGVGESNGGSKFRSDHPDYVKPKGITEAARQWQGWGTALKPACEIVTWATKGLPLNAELDIIQLNLMQLEARLWLLWRVSVAEKISTLSQSEYAEACDIAQWSAEEVTNIQADLCGLMGMSLFELATNTSLSIVSSWRQALEENWKHGNTSTTETRSNTTIDLKTLRFSLSQITPESIIKACSLPGGFSANASTAESYFNASLLLLQSIRTLSATEPVIFMEAENCRAADVKPSLDPCIMARKPLVGAVAANVLEHGTGAINVDGCRVGTDGGTARSGQAEYPKNEDGTEDRSESWARTGHQVVELNSGRWPANVIHDGSEEVVGLFPNSKSTGGQASLGAFRNGDVYGKGRDERESRDPGYGDTGSAARFFYCAKASKRDRDEGCEQLANGVLARSNQAQSAASSGEVIEEGQGAYNKARVRKNNHPTVKPTDLMRYLCRLVTPPRGIVLDPFAGSGSTGKAAMLEGLKFVGIERDPGYCEIARARLSKAAEQCLLQAMEC